MKFGNKEILLITGVLCYLSITCTDGVAPRSRSRFQSRASWAAKARLSNPDQKSQGLLPLYGGIDYRRASRTRPSKFRPSVTRCCKVGEKAAKKEMSCNLDEHAVFKSSNMVHKAKLSLYNRQPQPRPVNTAAKDLVTRISKCAASKFSANLEKCCKYREQFMKELAACSKDHKGAQKRQCRQSVRRRYP